MDAPDSIPLWPDSPEEFCAALRAARQRRGLTLADISQQTKVTESHFVALERADLRHWPKGIFRRAFFSDYVRAVGLPLEPTVAAFARLFPDPAAPSPEVRRDLRGERVPELQRAGAGEMRLALVRSPLIAPGAEARARLAACDAAIVLAVASAGAQVVNADLAAAIAIVSLSYSFLATVIGRPHPGPMLLMRALSTIRPVASGLNRTIFRLKTETTSVPLGQPESMPRRWHAPNRIKAQMSRIASAVRWPATWPAIDLSRLKRIDLSRLKGIDLRRLKDATPRVIERLRRERAERDRAARPMARPRPDSPRHARARQEPAADGTGVRVRIRLPRREHWKQEH